MTRPFNQRVVCEHCGRNTTAESAFERWVRGESQLASSGGIVRYDLDVLLHRYMVADDLKSSREVQAMMFIEVKTYSANLTEAQRDTLGLLNQVLRNRKPNMHGSPRRQVGGQLRKAYSHRNRREVTLFAFGGHLLQMSGSCPQDSVWMRWDWTWDLTIQQLIEVMRFERDPDNPENMLDIRRRSQPFSKQLKLLDI